MIEIQNLSYVYPNDVRALNNVSLKISPGEFVALMGENGAGKTTLVKHLNGLLKPTEGTVLVNGADTRKTSVASLSRKVGLVFQTPDHQFFAETVKDEIAFALRNFGFDEEVIERRVSWAVNFMGLEDYLSSSPFLLSGGEKKRLALASVLSWDPEVLIMDEPTIGQDYGQKEKLMHLFLQLNTQGKTVIVATHDVEFVADAKPRVVLMAGGRILGDGEAEAILSDLDVLERCSVTPPQITQLIQILSTDLADRLPPERFSKRILDVDQAADLIVQAVKGRRTR